jgi:hypothetical protein
MEEKSDLELEIEKIRSQEKRFGWRNMSAQYFVGTLALVGSVGASLLAAFEAPKVLTAIVAAISQQQWQPLPRYSPLRLVR